jgi:hypothetical protein
MGKERNTRKEVKKIPMKSAKEKRKAKKERKKEKRYDFKAGSIFD